MTWTRGIEHASHAAAASYAIRHPASLPLDRPGTLRISVSGGEVWDLYAAVLLTVQVAQDSDGDFSTLATYQAEAGLSLPVAGLTHYAGIPTAWILTDHSDQTLLTASV